MNLNETKKITRELKKLGFTITDESGCILHFATLPYSGKHLFRDDDKNLIQLTADYYSVWYEAGINKNGVGDGKLPATALTYSIGFCLRAEQRDYRHKYFYEMEYQKFYGYSRTLPELINLLKQHLSTIKA